MQLSIVNLVQIAIATPAIAFGFVLLRRPAMRALSVLLFVFGVHMAMNFAEETGLIPVGLLMTPALGALYGPLFFLFVRGMVFKEGHLARKDFIHAAPAVLALVFSHWLIAARVLVISATVAYCGAALFLIWRYDKATRAVRSDVLSLRLNWVLAVLAGFIGLTVVDIVRMAIISVQPPAIQEAAYAAVLLSAGGLFSVLAERALSRPRAFAGLTSEEFGRAPEPITASPIDGHILQNEAAFARLAGMIKMRQLYAKPHLTLAQTASEALLTEREVSFLINQIGGRSFCNFINALRVETAAASLRDPGQSARTILDIALDVGFTSKSTFNAAFKMEMGVTPSSWRRSKNEYASENTNSDDTISEKG